MLYVTEKFPAPPPSTSGNRPSTSTNAAFHAYQLRTASLRTNRKTLVCAVTALGNQSKTAVCVLTLVLTKSSKCLIPWLHRWKHPAQKYSFAVTRPVTAPRQMRCFVDTGLDTASAKQVLRVPAPPKRKPGAVAGLVWIAPREMVGSHCKKPTLRNPLRSPPPI